MKKRQFLCVYCEQSPTEVFPDKDELVASVHMRWVRLNKHILHLCPTCHETYAPSATIIDSSEMFAQPIRFPRGTYEVEHCCPKLVEQGFSDKECLQTIRLEHEGDVYRGKCPYCFAVVESPVNPPDIQFRDR
jgi:hypothetical protein